MKLIINSWFVFTCMMLAAAGCEEMNDKHRPYLENGEIIYVGKVDSVKSFAGDERIMFRYWISDPRVKTLTVSWMFGKESVEINVPAHLPLEPFDLYIGKNEKSMVEGSHTFQWTARDHHGNRSVVFENGASVYGPRYKNSLSNRPLVRAGGYGSGLSMTWGGSISDDEVGVLVRYTGTTEAAVTRRYTRAEIASPVMLTDVKLTAPVTYQTLYLPESAAIDTFCADPLQADVQPMIEVAHNIVLNKPVTHSDADPAANSGQMAVDGVTEGNATRWVSNTSNAEHWIDVDLQGTYDISAFRMWRDLSNAAQRMKQFRLQAWVDYAWLDVVSEDDNEVAIYYREFNRVTTDRVRLYIPAYTDNRARVFEMEVYSIVRY